jgi:hypothetical protein
VERGRRTRDERAPAASHIGGGGGRRRGRDGKEERERERERERGRGGVEGDTEGTKKRERII